MRRLVVIGCSVGLLGSLVVALASAAPTDERLKFAIVGVQARVGGDAVRSSGVVIDADAGLVLTSAQSVWGATSLRLTTGVGLLHGRIVARAPCTGIALLEVQPRIPGLVALQGGGAAGGHLVRQHSPGAPVIDADGRIAAIAVGARTTVPWSLIAKRLAELKPDAHRIYVGWRDEYRCTPQLHALTKARHPRFREIDARLNAPVPASRVPGTQGLDG